MIYITLQGDTFDRIAKEVYQNERRMDRLIEANPAYGSTVVFSAGTVLLVPELEEREKLGDRLPPWR